MKIIGVPAPFTFRQYTRFFGGMLLTSSSIVFECTGR
jgi:hypothetical protein